MVSAVVSAAVSMAQDQTCRWCQQKGLCPSPAALLVGWLALLLAVGCEGALMLASLAIGSASLAVESFREILLRRLTRVGSSGWRLRALTCTAGDARGE